jgi:hypothetical protein
LVKLTPGQFDVRLSVRRLIILVVKKKCEWTKKTKTNLTI